MLLRFPCSSRYELFSLCILNNYSDDFFLQKYDSSEVDILIGDHKSMEPGGNFLEADQSNALRPPPGFSRTASNGLNVPKPHILSLTEAFNDVPAFDSKIKEKSWAQVSGENISAEASNQSTCSNTIVAGNELNLLSNYESPALAMGPGGPVWVAPHGQPLGQQALYPNVAYAGAIPSLPVADSYGIREDSNNRRSKMMKSADIKFVVNKVMAPLEIVDAFSDDFYFLQFALKKNYEQRRMGATSGGRLIPPLIIPLPTWKATRERVKLQLIETKMKQEYRSRQWEEKEKVLGHLTKSDASKPRSVLSISLIDDTEMKRTRDEDQKELRHLFATKLWGMRLAVQRGHEALSTVQELQHLLSQPVILGNAAVREELMKDMDRAIKLLSTSVGVNYNLSGYKEVLLEGGLVAAILQTTKGKKLMCRSIELLDDEQRWALTPVILTRVLLTDHNDQLKVDKEVEEHLLTIISRFIIEAYNRFETSSTRFELNVTKDTKAKMIFHLWQCLRNVVVSQANGSLLQKALLSSRVRAEVMQNVVQTGDRILGADECIKHSEEGEKWKHVREAFMCMLDNQNY